MKMTLDADPEFAAKVANDVAEDIDCHETRIELRSVIRFWAMAHCKVSAERSLARSESLTLKALIELLISELKRRPDNRSKAMIKLVRRFQK